MENLILSNTTLVVSLRCDLKCKLCAVHAPYYDISPHFTFDELRESINLYFGTVDFVDKFTLNGGEPFLHKDLPRIVDYLQAYSGQIGLLEILTNGTIIPDANLLTSLKNAVSMDVMVNDYGTKISKANEVCDSLAAAGIRYRYREQHDDVVHFGGWVDLTDLSRKNRTSGETAEIYSKCAYPGPFNCFAIIGGKGYICGVYKRAEYLGIIPDNPDEYVDLSDKLESVEVRRAKIKNFKQRKYLSACAYCAGFCEASPRFMPAEQLEK
jgi:organic radical activating enzyme